MRSHEVTAVRLPTRRTGSRYRIAEVDAFLEECANALSTYERRQIPVLPSTDVITAAFGAVQLFGTGYDADAVDTLLDEVALQLRAHESQYGRAAEVQEAQKAQEAELRGMLDQIRQQRPDGRG